MLVETIKKKIRDIYDFPQKGIIFRDLTTAFKDKDCLHELSESLTDLYKNKGITKVVGIESRGFIMGPIMANNLGAGFVTMRKPGKLPAETWSESYEKEYGTDTIEIHKDALDENDIVVLHDDLLATGGTMIAAYNLVKRFNPQKIYVNFIVELEFLNGRNVFPADVEIDALIKY
ncbi:adenine phosphoribosyltransferase [Coprobacter tertius]|uniref:Adenine phosphoribosyltransferase n=1 Tax=Coprobacter tertius TaxID=2944915 RepID=A0ABT1MD75_9BACT|nr:adenine phosphoribosyltransferase [Coprobacter tertius]MCP9610585.1 adenine phosphoribosyltransferase [Coprobacter tertius]